MKFLRLWLLVVWVAAAGVASTFTACHAPVTVVTPAGQSAYTADQVLQRVERLQNAVLEAHASGDIPRETARAIVFATVEIAEFADAAQADWRTMVKQAWAQAKADIPALATERFSVYVKAIDALLGGLL